MARYEISVQSQDAVDEARSQLQALDVDLDDVTSISIELEVDRSLLAQHDEHQRTLDELAEELTESQDDIEIGPRLEEPEPRGPKRMNFPDDHRAYKGIRYEDAVMPDTLHRQVLDQVDGKWRTTGDVAEALGETSSLISAYLTTDLHEHGYVKRRTDSTPYEYTLTRDGKSAIELGERLSD